MEKKFMLENGVNECYEIHSLFYDHCIGDFELFKTLEEAERIGKEKMENSMQIRMIVIKRYFRDENHTYYDGTRTWRLQRC